MFSLAGQNWNKSSFFIINVWQTSPGFVTRIDRTAALIRLLFFINVLSVLLRKVAVFAHFSPAVSVCPMVQRGGLLRLPWICSLNLKRAEIEFIITVHFAPC